eukprot:11589.XXX_219184_220261_1 [CDS] Oithona nana genome sequencing.
MLAAFLSRQQKKHLQVFHPSCLLTSKDKKRVLMVSSHFKASNIKVE